MAKMSSNPANWKDRLKAELGRDKKKTIILSILLTVGGVVGGKLVITQALPSDADAVEAAPTDPAASEQAVADPADLTAWAPAGASRDQARRAEYLAQMDRSITGNPFKVNLSSFPGIGADGAECGHNPLAVGWLGTVHQRLVQKQRQQGEQLARARAVRTEAEALTLQTIMLGSSPAVLINGQVLRQGERIDGFVIKSIDINRCVVSKDGVDVELRMD